LLSSALESLKKEKRQGTFCLIMSNNSKKRPFRERREIRETIPERIPKKHRNRSDSNDNTSQREDALMPEEDLLDPVAEARKALEMFEEVSGETNMHVISKKDASINGDADQSRDGHGHLNNNIDSERVPSANKNANGSVTNMIHQNKKIEGGLNCDAPKEGRKGEKTTQTRKDEEDKATQKKTNRGWRSEASRISTENCWSSRK